MDAPHNADISKVLHDKLIPLITQRGIDCVTVASPCWKSGEELPEGMTASHIALRGKKKRIRGARPYGASLTDFVWHEDRLHSTRTPVLCFILKGPLAYQIADYELHCEAGHGILIPPGIPYADGSYFFLDSTKMHQGNCTMIQLQPYLEGLCCWSTHFWLDEQKQLKHNEQVCSVPGNQISEYLYQLLDEMQSRKPCWEEICNSILSLMLWTLYRDMQHLPTFGGGTIPTARQPRLAWSQIEQYIQENLAQDISIDTLAHRAAMSRRVFTEQFRSRTGKTIVQYTTDLRLEKADKLLRETDLAVQQVAGAVGLKPNRLRVLFHEREGMSPVQYRQKGEKNS